MNLLQETGTKVSVRITTPRNAKGSIDLATSPQKTTFVSGGQLLDLMKIRYFVNKKPYDGFVIMIDELSGPEAGSLRINVRFGLARMVTFTLGWKNRSADVSIGNDSFRIELI